MELIQLGATDLRVTPLGIGTWAWGDKRVWGYGNGYAEDDLRQAFHASREAGINFFDTAELYGSGRSEQFLGCFVQEAEAHPGLLACVPQAGQAATRARDPGQGAGGSAVIATKFMPFPWRLRQRSLIEALQRSLDRLGLKSVDLYQIHWPFPPVPIEIWMTGLADAVHAELTRTAGVSNYNCEQMRRAHVALAKRGIPLASNQVQYSLLHRDPERNGLLDACRELAVTLIAYSPLAQGLLSGKYTPENPPPGVRGRRFGRDYLARLQPLVGLLREIGQAHGGRQPVQVALNWTICKGTLPIPGAKNERQARENAGALGWRLTLDELTALDGASDKVNSK